MIELTYRRIERVKVKAGVGSPPLRDQIAPDAQVSTLVDGVATVLHPITTKLFKTVPDLESFLENFHTDASDILEISRKVLASS